MPIPFDVYVCYTKSEDGMREWLAFEKRHKVFLSFCKVMEADFWINVASSINLPRFNSCCVIFERTQLAATCSDVKHRDLFVAFTYNN
uniref:Uncharacterized protein n=1 Tax=Arundo donax TaxID=35708 RepID=A0A0A9H9N6_ARUDO